MWMPTSPLVLAAFLSTVGLVSADHILSFPFVDQGEAGEVSDEWKDFHGQVMDVSNGLTTYSVGCASNPCDGWENLPDFTYTVIIGPNTWDMKYSDEPILSTHTACTFLGSPITQASCEMTNTGHIRTHSLGYEHHFMVPNETGLDKIRTATLTIIDGTAVPSRPYVSASVSTTSTTSTTVGAASGSVSSTAKAQRTAAAVAPWVLGAGVAAGAVLGV
ncbi:hypothetical protein K505DRAFT_330028 [Melanomma pulvis-pyrius CBS 109.77]|uniref:Lytic polysaccharide monooxygenase n=1 Tax=Melanomma pulvis-pyrius CBS 109.77 TaxID=1314802 RepID=A0A6A6WSX3_9PLEO|nr:hypothetical protein K505DRAFT_330028 [Melanomma pulvis-pyrius CBS 109.77]